MPAYVYLITEEPFDGEVSGPWTKIGYSKNPPEWRMIANLKRGNPRNIHVVAAFEFETVAEARATEMQVHEHFHDLAHQKEWFNVAWQDVSFWLESKGAKRRDKSGKP